MATDIARCLKKSIHCLISNRTKEFCQNFKIALILVEKHRDIILRPRLLKSIEN